MCCYFMVNFILLDMFIFHRHIMLYPFRTVLAVLSLNLFCGRSFPIIILDFSFLTPPNLFSLLLLTPLPPPLLIILLMMLLIYGIKLFSYSTLIAYFPPAATYALCSLIFCNPLIGGKDPINFSDIVHHTRSTNYVWLQPGIGYLGRRLQRTTRENIREEMGSKQKRG